MLAGPSSGNPPTNLKTVRLTTLRQFVGQGRSRLPHSRTRNQPHDNQATTLNRAPCRKTKARRESKMTWPATCRTSNSKRLASRSRRRSKATTAAMTASNQTVANPRVCTPSSHQRSWKSRLRRSPSSQNTPPCSNPEPAKTSASPSGVSAKHVRPASTAPEPVLT